VAPSPPRLSDAAGEQGSVGGLELGTLDLAAEHGELVTQHQDLQVLGGVPAGEQGEQLDGAAQREGGEVRQHQVSSAGGAEAPPYQPLRPGTPAHSPRPSLRTPQVVGLAVGQPAPDGPLRAPRRHPDRVPASGLRAALRPQAATVVNQLFFGAGLRVADVSGA
jgi:hypothetical protein